MSDVGVQNSTDVRSRGHTASGIYATGGKRFLDVAIVVLIAPIVIPIIVGAWLATRLSGGPGFFGHARIGRDGMSFNCWKICTMARDADKMLAQHLKTNPAANREWEKTQKLKVDPRITKLGYVLRASSIDELPQLWNVLRGEMSLVGPRPFTPNQKDLYDSGSPRRCYYDLRPGLTGPWQIESRNRGEFIDRARFDEQYSDDMSITYDAKLALRTIGVVLRATGK